MPLKAIIHYTEIAVIPGRYFKLNFSEKNKTEECNELMISMITMQHYNTGKKQQ
jgi:hypothetical protein